jgi:diacylglycerol kinase family enzyme
MTMAIMVNERYIVGGFQPVYKAKINDGFIDFVIVPDSSSFKFLKSLIKKKK